MTTLKLHAEPVQDAWLDAYGHLNEAYYLVAFSNATWPLQDHFAVGTDYFDETGCALYTVESHIRYINEVRAPAQLEIESLILDVDPKKLHIAHIMMVDGTERATFECLLLHFNSREGRVAPFPDDRLAALQDAMVADKPDWSGRSVAIKKK